MRLAIERKKHILRPTRLSVGPTVSQAIAEKEVTRQNSYTVRQFPNLKNADAVKSGRSSPMFRRNVLPPSSGSRSSLPDYVASHLGRQSLP
jgi:hypothetical protein